MSSNTTSARVESSSSSGFFSWLREREEDESIWHCCWDASPPEKSGSEEEPIVVIDIGSYHLRAHVAEKRGDEEEQSLVLPACIRRPWSGEASYLDVERGVVQNWDEVEDALLDLLDNQMPLGLGGSLGGDGPGRFLSCVSSLRSPAHFARLGELFFELLGAQQFLNVDQDLLSALAICGCSYVPPLPRNEAGDLVFSDPFAACASFCCQRMQNFTGVIIDMGTSTTRIAPLLSGVALSGIALELPIGGVDLDWVVKDDLDSSRLTANVKNGQTFSGCSGKFSQGKRSKPEFPFRPIKLPKPLAAQPTGRQYDGEQEVLSKRSGEEEEQNTRQEEVDLATARQGKESLAYCIVEPAASDPAASAVLSAERDLCAAHPEAFEEIREAFATRKRNGFDGRDERRSLLLSQNATRDDEELHGQPRKSNPGRLPSPLRQTVHTTYDSSSRLCSLPSTATQTGKGRRWLSTSRVMAAELFFDEAFLERYRRRHHRGSLEALDVLSLQAAIAQVVERCPVDLKRELLENIYVVGGSSLIPGVAARLQAEITHLMLQRKAHSSIRPRVHVLPSSSLQL
ncbi:actin-like family protein [Cystoisospora suis]|uniref:Actin-like family protein n=1 Tax=Cystoisospora suis TaxID=483139 RepID=A0A2C6KNH5_9APIC|nr:actin-like family protein [Cystoisospora suis]